MGTVLLGAACTHIGNYAEKRADRAAYGNIRGAQLRALGKADDFTINKEDSAELLKLFMTTLDSEEAETLSLADALAIAIANSRTYQSRKEDLFIQALNLTGVQKDFNWNYSASASANTSYTTHDDGTTETFGDNGVNGNIDLGMSRILLTGARVSLGFSQNVLEYFTDPDTSDANSALSLNIVQPLLNGAGPLITQEPLRQAERNMVYAVRAFKRFQQQFVIDIASRYYDTLQSRDQLINAQKDYESSVATREESELRVKVGKLSDYEAAQARQRELEAAVRLANTRVAYQRTLDNFRFDLGLPIGLNVVPDPTELDALAQRGLVEVDITLQEAATSAISNRLDLITNRQQVEDQERNLEIQRRDFLPNLDVSYDATKHLEQSAGSDTDVSQNLGVSLNLPLDWTRRRNAYRIAQINLDREQRNLEENEWNVQIEVRNLWRSLESNRSVYRNSLLSVQLQERQVDVTRLKVKNGTALTRDLLDAQRDLLNARNGATTALVDYTLTRLNFWNSIERFEIDPKGMWYEEVDGTGEGTVETP